jgi:hypothetical protein
VFQLYFFLLDNTIPNAVLFYTDIFKSGNYVEHKLAIKRFWLQALLYNRKNYKYNLLELMSLYEYWESTSHPLAEYTKNHLRLFTEYCVENVHSRLRRVTEEWFTGDQVRKAAIQLFDMDDEIFDFENLYQKDIGHKEKKQNLGNKMLTMQTMASFYLVECFLLIGKNINIPATKITVEKTILFSHPCLENALPPKLFPLGYFEKELIETKPCFLDTCSSLLTENIVVLVCGHAYHSTCYSSIDHCKLCLTVIKKQISKLKTNQERNLKKPTEKEEDHQEESLQPDSDEDSDSDSEEHAQVFRHESNELKLKLDRIEIKFD